MARKPSSQSSFIVAAALLAVLAQTSMAAAAPETACGEAQAVQLPNGSTGCTHGPDPAPIGAPATTTFDLQAAAVPKVRCVGDGVEGERVQALYVVAADRPDRSDELIPQIRQWIADVDTIFSESSVDDGVDMMVRWVHNGSCIADVKTVVIPADADDTFSATIGALAAAGYAQSGRHYLTWVDASVYCGIAVNYSDDSADQGNLNNGGWPLWARVDQGCWGRDGLVEAHELTHMLGGVQASAPNATGNGHCTDEYDVMCYPDGPGATMTYECPDASNELRLDCNDDDYFDPSPPPGSYLKTHWNVATSAFLNGLPITEPEPPVDPPEPPAVTFDDIGPSHAFRADIEWLAGEGITRGCNPPANTNFCADDPITRGQMAAFLTRALTLGDGGSGDAFTDDDATPFESDIERLAAAGITTGCGPEIFCPNDPITRGQMAAFLTRALTLTAGVGDPFTDDNNTPFESDIERLAAAGITTGCGPEIFCPDAEVTRGQMAAFLRRALAP